VPDIHITRGHALGLQSARKLAFRWAEEAEDRLGMDCVYEEGRVSDVVAFTRSGVNGELKVTKDKFVLDARLGLLLGAFKGRIETEIVKNLDELLAHEEPHKAFEKTLDGHDRSKAGATAARPSAKKKA
jgi:putative polyhydroxyalkanoate system protein